MMHRIFLAINLPEQIKKELLKFQNQWADLPVRWTKKDNLHITLVFLGYLNDEEILEVCKLTRKAAQKHQPFEIKLKRIYLGPNNLPRMIWIKGEENPDLVKLKNNLEGKLLNHRENRPFQVHITLARIRQGEWQRLPDKPKIDKEISLVFPVDSIEIMESYLSRKGPDYTVLESVELGN